MSTLRKQMLAKHELGFAEWANQPGIKTSRKGRESKALKACTVSTLVLCWKILLGEQIQTCSRAFLFSKLTYKSLLYPEIPCIHPFFLISA